MSWTNNLVTTITVAPEAPDAWTVQYHYDDDSQLILFRGDDTMKRIPAFRLIPEPLTDEARQSPGFKWAGPEIGTRHQLGGSPARPPKDEDWPRCPDCGQDMTFYGQLDSISDDICIADAGLISVFICFECNEVKAAIASP